MTDELKKALEAAKTEEEMLAVAREYEHELKTLSDEELEKVAGGYCPRCVYGKMERVPAEPKNVKYHA